MHVCTAGTHVRGGRGCSHGAVLGLDLRHHLRPVIRHNGAMTVERVAWSVTVLVALITALLLLLSGYNGYAGLGLAVAISAAINLL
jgi:hypothetical protein